MRSVSSSQPDSSHSSTRSVETQERDCLSCVFFSFHEGGGVVSFECERDLLPKMEERRPTRLSLQIHTAIMLGTVCAEHTQSFQNGMEAVNLVRLGAMFERMK